MKGTVSLYSELNTTGNTEWSKNQALHKSQTMQRAAHEDVGLAWSVNLLFFFLGEMMECGNAGLEANSTESNYVSSVWFRTKNEKVCCLMFPILFIRVGDVLTRMLIKAAEADSIKGLLSDFRNKGLKVWYSIIYRWCSYLLRRRPYPSPKSEVNSSVVWTDLQDKISFLTRSNRPWWRY